MHQTAPQQMLIEGISVQLFPARGKRGSIRIDRRTGEVRLMQPPNMTLQEVEYFLRKKLPWIRKHRDALTTSSNRKEPLMPIHYTDGEYVTLEGKVYRLLVQLDDHPSLELLDDHGTILLKYNPTSKRQNPAQILRHWMFERLSRTTEELTKKWADTMGVTYTAIRYRTMKSTWGSCNHPRGLITYNTLLIYFPIHCIEYIVVHELAHLIEPNHSSSFYRIVEKCLPLWRNSRKCLLAPYPESPTL